MVSSLEFVSLLLPFARRICITGGRSFINSGTRPICMPLWRYYLYPNALRCADAPYYILLCAYFGCFSVLCAVIMVRRTSYWRTFHRKRRNSTTSLYVCCLFFCLMCATIIASLGQSHCCSDFISAFIRRPTTRDKRCISICREHCCSASRVDRTCS